MKSIINKYLLLISFLLGLTPLKSQNNTSVFIENITIQGNTKTKDKIILREITFRIGDTIPLDKLPIIISQNQNNLYNTRLFSKVNINVNGWEGNKISFEIKVTELWYIFPIPIFELADRNFNVWWNEQNHKLSRTNYGLYLEHKNLSGRNDQIKTNIQGGYTKKLELQYGRPWINKKQNLGYLFNILQKKSKEVALNTEKNKLIFKNAEKIILQQFRLKLGLIFRPKISFSQSLFFSYFKNQIDQTSFDTKNEIFFLNTNGKQAYFSINYALKWDKRVQKAYPIGGYLLNFWTTKKGLNLIKDINALQFGIEWQQYIPLNEKLIFSYKIVGITNAIRKQLPYNQTISLGYGSNQIAGYEYYVIDGMDLFYYKTATRFELLKKELKVLKDFPIQSLQTIPLGIYFKVKFEGGFVNSIYYKENGYLNNQVLLGGGIGLDFVILNNRTISISYHINKFAEKYLFLDFNSSF